MARIRTVKPEFWTSEQIVECSPIARLLFIGLWNFADDNGVHSASVRRIRMEIFPADHFSDADIAQLIDELIQVDLIAPYATPNGRFWAVTGWERHQKIERPTYRHPLPDGTIGRMTDEIRRAITESSPIPHREIGDRSTPEWNGMEWSRRKAPSQGGDSQPTTSTTERGEVGAAAEFSEWNGGAE